jgi:hypothetical protein
VCIRLCGELRQKRRAARHVVGRSLHRYVRGDPAPPGSAAALKIALMDIIGGAPVPVVAVGRIQPTKIGCARPAAAITGW